MQLAEIKKIALNNNNEVTKFFKECYRHSLNALETIPEEKLKEILSKKRKYDNGSNGIIEGISVYNYYDKNRKKSLDKVMIVFEERLSDGDIIYDKAEFTVQTNCFDYLGLSVKFFLNDDNIEFFDDGMGLEDIGIHIKREFLKNIFRDCLISVEENYSVVVEKRFFTE